jgi:hypothetical protein
MGEQIPPLAAPHPAIPPGFWEMHGTIVLVLGMVVLALLVIGAWLLLRPKPTLPIPAEAQARQSLEPLRDKTEDGQVLSRVSQATRRYFSEAFGLGTGEMTTSEISASLVQEPAGTPELASSVSSFLRACDERRFQPGATAEPLQAVSKALGLIEEGEKRLAQLRAQAERAAAEQQAKPG